MWPVKIIGWRRRLKKPFLVANTLKQTKAKIILIDFNQNRPEVLLELWFVLSMLFVGSAYILRGTGMQRNKQHNTNKHNIRHMNQRFSKGRTWIQKCIQMLCQQIIIGRRGSLLSRPPHRTAVCRLPSPWLVSIKWMVLLAAEACVACLPWVQMMSGTSAGYRHCRLLITSGRKKK